MRAALLIALLAGCGPGPWEGRWTGTLTRASQCSPADGTSSQDVLADWVVEQSGRHLSLAPGWGCAAMPALVDSRRDDWADFTAGADCPTTSYSGGIINTQRLAGGYLNRYETRLEVVLMEWDIGETPRGRYECEGASYGVLERVVE